MAWAILKALKNPGHLTNIMQFEFKEMKRYNYIR